MILASKWSKYFNPAHNLPKDRFASVIIFIPPIEIHSTTTNGILKITTLLDFFPNNLSFINGLEKCLHVLNKPHFPVSSLTSAAMSPLLHCSVIADWFSRIRNFALSAFYETTLCRLKAPYLLFHEAPGVQPCISSTKLNVLINTLMHIFSSCVGGPLKDEEGRTWQMKNFEK